MNINQEDIKLIEKFIEIKNKGYYADGKQLTEVYNRVLNKNANVTSCGSCLRQRVNELEAALNYIKELTKKQEELKVSNEVKNEEVDNVTPDENKAFDEAENKPTEKKRVGRPRKN